VAGDYLWLAKIAVAQKSLTLASPIATLRAMRDVSRSCAAVRSASSTRRDLLLESLALRHQLNVLARSNRRFRPSDRLLWLLLRWLWPRWREALVLVSGRQPSIVGIAWDSVEAGAVARVIPEDHASIQRVAI